MVELIVVLLIVGIVLALAASSFRAPRRGAELKAVKGAAMSYSQAILAFAQDHSGRAPCAGGGVCPVGDWSSTLELGPLEPLPDSAGRSRRYMRGGIPDAISDGLAAFMTTPVAVGSSMPPNGRAGIIVYIRDSGDPSQYRLEVWRRSSSGTAEPDCWYGTSPPAGGGWPTGTEPTC